MKFFIVFFALLSVCTIGKSQHWQEAYEKAQQAFETDDVASAEVLGINALAVAHERHGENSNEAINTLQLIIQSQAAQGKIKEAIEYSEKLTSSLEKSYGKENQFYAQSVILLGNFLIEDGQSDKALKLYISAKNIIKSQYSIDNPDYAFFLSDLAYLYLNAGKEDEAVTAYIEAVDALQHIGANDTYTFDVINNLRKLLIKKNKNELAIRYGRKLIGFENKIDIKASDLATVNTDLAASYISLNKNDSAQYFLLQTKNVYDTNDNLLKEDQYSYVINQLAYISSLSGDNKSVNKYLQEQNSIGEDKTSLFNQAVIAQNNGNLDQASQFYAKLFTLEAKKELNSLDQIKLYDYYSLYSVKVNDHHKASEFITKAVSIGKKEYGNKSANYLSLVAHQALIEKSFGNLLKAKEIYTSLISDINKLNLKDTELYVDVLSHNALNMQQLNDIQQARRLLREAVEKAESIDYKKDNLAVLYNNYAVVLQQSGDYINAEHYQLKSLELIGESYGFEHSNYAYNLINLGEIYVKQGSFKQADSVFNKSKELMVSIYGEGSPEFAMVMVNATKVDKSLGKYAKADKSYIAALKILEEAGDKYKLEFAYALNDYALLLKDFGNYGLSERYSKNAASIFKTMLGDLNPDYVSSLGNLSNLYQLQDRNDEVEIILKEVLKIDKQLYGKLHPKYSTTLHNLASLYQRQEKIEEAITLYNEALEIDSAIYGVKHHSYANTLYNIADLYDTKGEFEKGLSAYKQVLAIMEDVYGVNNPEYIYRLYGVAKINQRLRKNEEALVLYRKIAESYLYQLQEFFPVLSEEQKSLFYAKVNPIFNSYRELLLNMYKDKPELAGELFDLQLNTKAILLNASNQLRNEINSNKDPEVRRHYELLVAKKNELINYYNYSKEDLAKVGIDLHVLENELNNLEKTLSQKLIHFADVYEKDQSWKDIRSILNPEEVVVEMVRIEETMADNAVSYAALILAKDYTNPKMVHFKNGKELESNAYSLYKNSLTYDVNDSLSYFNFWKPIDELTSNYDIIHLSPDGIYNKLSINTFYNSQSKKHIIEEQLISFVSSTKDILKKTESKGESKNTAYLFGYPIFNINNDQLSSSISQNRLYEKWMTNIDLLPGTKNEVADLEVMLKKNNWNTTKNIEVAASEEALKNVKSPKVLHIATHGYFSEDITFTSNSWKDKDKVEEYDFNPLLRSGLLFTNAETTVRKRLSGVAVNTDNDGILTAYEAMNLNLSGTDLIVLSACETGLGEVKNGEGVYGLQRAFLVSGAKNIIMSLWKVDDKVTQELMQNFYSHWITSGNLHESLRKAELEIKEKYKNPSLWGAFVINGL